MAKATTANKQPRDADRKEVQWIELAQLRLDSNNPRLKEGMENATQGELLTELAREYELQDLGRSIADNGYFSEEPLVAVRDRGERTWTVVEGNRRLAALQLLENPNSAPKELRNQWQELAQSRQKRVTVVPILEYAQRNEVTPYLGFQAHHWSDAVAAVSKSAIHLPTCRE